VGPLNLPASGSVYLDANAIIYSYELVEPYRTLLEPVWLGAGPQSYSIITSELTLLEVLVGPLKQGNANLEAGFRDLLLRSTNVRSVPITQPILEEGARLRVTTNLRTPDAIHAATALQEGCALLVEDLQAALEQFAAIADDLNGKRPDGPGA
jgi:predicted nucleic acid-binding protein